MAALNFAYTVPFPKDTKITQEQAFEALRIKCREPMKFVPMIVACEVLDETPTTMRRKATMKTGQVMIEDMVLYKPSLVTFKADTGLYVTNLISETEDGTKLLTFTFSFPLPPGVELGTEAATAKAQEMKAAAQGAVGGSLKTILEMFEEGRLN